MALAVAHESRDYVDHYWETGYAVVRGFFTTARMRDVQAETRRIYREGLKHHTTYRDRNLLFEILPESFAGKRYVLQAHWFSWISPYFEALRRDPRYYEILSPLLGRDIKQVAQQFHWKPPGAGLTGFRFHQDMRFRERKDAFRDLMSSYVTTGLAIDPATRENGCLRVIPRSHLSGYLGLSDDGPLMKGETQVQELRQAGLAPASIVDLELEPGDLALWSLLTVHGSEPNRSDLDRAFALSSYVKAENSDRGEWAFRNGVSTPLGTEPQLCKYEKLRENPGPFYSDDTWYAG
ncbi:MAG: phytanoyl-CoA dioxygenase family protein [Proteobacteria bacterium]|nr:phytanoyl-CoA dioxygenase family protein [Pseudomonadota bacterium]MBI3497242.1 phytanoyl-CoA dioxygenase family protein [Pseudomonadota bacterium]